MRGCAFASTKNPFAGKPVWYPVDFSIAESLSVQFQSLSLFLRGCEIVCFLHQLQLQGHSLQVNHAQFIHRKVNGMTRRLFGDSHFWPSKDRFPCEILAEKSFFNWATIYTKSFIHIGFNMVFFDWAVASRRFPIF
jgi:hypothetical protein